MKTSRILGLAIFLMSSGASAQTIFHLEGGKFPTTPLTPAIGGQVKYFGGRVISNVEIVEVAWGSSVDSGYLTQLQGFYTAIAPSAFIDWMTEYDTIGLSGFSDLAPGSNQHIGRGAYASTVVITPNNQSTNLSDQDIQTELVAQLTAKTLPAPALDANGNVDSLYMFDFPAGTTITLVNIQSCQSFGAYHFTTTYNGMSIPYGVHPDCGYSFQQATIVHSHELAEALTDTEVGLVETNTTNLCARPLAWTTYASTAWASQEIADICQGNYDQIAGYTVQKIWSNYAQGCVAQIPICDGVLAPPACRPCSEFDDEAACTNACATAGSKDGQCVPCTSKDAKACSGATPVCDDATYACVQCEANSDCKDPTEPVCDATHVCRGCAHDSECSNGQVCDELGDAGVSSDASTDGGDAGQSFPKGQCVDCNTSAQCQEGSDLHEPHMRCRAHRGCGLGRRRRRRRRIVVGMWMRGHRVERLAFAWRFLGRRARVSGSTPSSATSVMSLQSAWRGRSTARRRRRRGREHRVVDVKRRHCRSHRTCRPRFDPLRLACNSRPLRKTRAFRCTSSWVCRSPCMRRMLRSSNAPTASVFVANPDGHATSPSCATHTAPPVANLSSAARRRLAKKPRRRRAIFDVSVAESNSHVPPCAGGGLTR